MTAERPVKPPVPKELKDVAVAVPLISPATAESTTPIVARVIEGKPPEVKDVTKMVENVARDLREQGVPISSDDIRAVQERVAQGMSPSSSEARKTEVKKPAEHGPLPEIDLNEYKTVVNDLVRNYGVDKQAWGNISHIIGVTTLVGDFLGGMQRKMFATKEGRDFV